MRRSRTRATLPGDDDRPYKIIGTLFAFVLVSIGVIILAAPAPTC